MFYVQISQHDHNMILLVTHLMVNLNIDMLENHLYVDLQPKLDHWGEHNFDILIALLILLLQVVLVNGLYDRLYTILYNVDQHVLYDVMQNHDDLRYLDRQL
eukprot:UN07255